MKVIISCSKTQKQVDQPISLYYLYNSKLAKLKRDYALKLVNHELDKVFIISGEKGLVPITTKSLPYDSKFRSLSKIHNKISLQVQLYDFNYEEDILYIGSKKYGNYLKSNFLSGIYFDSKLENCRSNIEYMQRLEKLVNDVSDKNECKRNRL